MTPTWTYPSAHAGLYAPPPTSRTARRRSLGPIAIATALVAALVASMLVAVIQSPPAAAATQTSLVASDAAWTTTRAPSTPQRGNFLSVTASQDRTFLKFDGSSLEGQTVTSAVLVLRVRSTTATQPGIVAYPTSADWSSSSLTSAKQPSATGPAVSKASAAPKAGQVLRIPIAVSAISTTGDFALRLEYVQRFIRLQLMRTGADAPQLVLTHDDTPEAEPSTPEQPAPRPADAPLVFAHYFTPYPLSLDNQPADSDYYARNYLSPSGEGGKFASRGGLLRDRPLATQPQTASDWQTVNFATEIEQAQSAGIDGWVVDLLSTGGRNWDSALQIMDAADENGSYYVVPMVDTTSSFGDASPATAAQLLSQMYAHESAYQEDGEYLLSSFKAEGNSVSWWRQVISLLENSYGIPITFQAVFLDASVANMQAFAPIADGFGNWGKRTVAGAQSSPNYVERAAALDRTWMQAVAVQDVRYKDGRWAEAENTEAFRAQWELAIEQGADYVQLVTWNDYSESTQIAPSMAHGTAFLDIVRYYADWYHTGEEPDITSDEIVLTHRTQFVGAIPSLLHTLMDLPLLGGAGTPARDRVEALVWLTEPATVRITAGGRTTSFDAPAGLSSYTVPLALGSVSAAIVRDGTTVTTLASPHRVVAIPYVQDLQYWAASSW